MGSRFVWFLIGLGAGMALMSAVRRVEECKEAEDFEAVAESLRERFARLEGEQGAGK